MKSALIICLMFLAGCVHNDKAWDTVEVLDCEIGASYMRNHTIDFVFKDKKRLLTKETREVIADMINYDRAPECKAMVEKTNGKN